MTVHPAVAHAQCDRGSFTLLPSNSKQLKGARGDTGEKYAQTMITKLMRARIVRRCLDATHRRAKTLQNSEAAIPLRRAQEKACARSKNGSRSERGEAANALKRILCHQNSQCARCEAAMCHHMQVKRSTDAQCAQLYKCCVRITWHFVCQLNSGGWRQGNLIVLAVWWRAHSLKCLACLM